jgi:hypothetical protein
MPSGISAKHNETPGSRLKSIVGMTRLMRFIWIKFIARSATLALGLVWAKRHDVSGRRPLLKRMNIKYSSIINHTHHSKMPAKSLAFVVESFNVCE